MFIRVVMIITLFIPLLMVNSCSQVRKTDDIAVHSAQSYYQPHTPMQQFRSHYFQALELEKLGRFEEAVGILKQLTEGARSYGVDNLHLNLRLAINYVRIGDIYNAVYALEQWLPHEQDKKRKHIRERSPAAALYSGLLISLKKYDDAESFLISEVQSWRGNIFELCERLYGLQKKQYGLEKARKTLKRCQEKDKDNYWSYQKFYADELFRDGDINLAQKIYENIYNSDRESRTSVIVKLMQIWKQNREEGLIELRLTEHLEKHPQDYEVMELLADWYSGQQHIEKAIPWLEKLTDYSRHDLTRTFRLGGVYLQQKRFKDARILFSQIIDNVADQSMIDRVRWYLALAYQGEEEDMIALENLKEIPVTSPIYSQVSMDILKLQLQLSIDQKNESNQWLQEADDFVKEVKYHLGGAIVFNLQSTLALHYYRELKDARKAIEIFEQLLGHEEFSLDYRLFLASLYDQVGQYEKFDNLMEPALDADPTNSEVLNLIGYSLLERPNGDLDLAGELLEKALALQPQSPHIMDSWGWYLFKKGKVQEAFGYLSQAYEKVKDDSTITLHYVEVLSHMSQKSTALAVLRESLLYIQDPEEKAVLTSQLKMYAGEYEKQSSKGSRAPASKSDFHSAD